MQQFERIGVNYSFVQMTIGGDVLGVSAFAGDEESSRFKTRVGSGSGVAVIGIVVGASSVVVVGLIMFPYSSSLIPSAPIGSAFSRTCSGTNFQNKKINKNKIQVNHNHGCFCETSIQGFKSNGKIKQICKISNA
jgi:hypothetical protein